MMKLRLPTLLELSLLAALPWTAEAHWQLAALLNAPVALRPLLPIALDSYLLAALRGEGKAKGKRPDLKWALALDGLAVAGSHAAVQLDPPPIAKAAISAVLGVILVLTIWRVHEIAPKKTTPRPVIESETTPAPASPKKPSLAAVRDGKRSAPSRDEARRLLLELDDMDKVSNAELSRLHGGSDVWWGQRKTALRPELPELTFDLQTELEASQS